MDVAPVLIGLAGGATVAALMPDIEPPSRSRKGRRRVRAMLAGLVGAVGAGYALVRLDPSLGTDGLTSALAGLAGPFWFAGTVEVYSSRRRRGDGGEARPIELSSPPAVPAYDGVREALFAGLIEDASAHEAGKYAGIGRRLQAIRATVSRQDLSWNSRLHLALRFWSGWAMGRDEGWRGSGPKTPIAVADCPASRELSRPISRAIATR